MLTVIHFKQQLTVKPGECFWKPWQRLTHTYTNTHTGLATWCHFQQLCFYALATVWYECVYVCVCEKEWSISALVVQWSLTVFFLLCFLISSGYFPLTSKEPAERRRVERKSPVEEDNCVSCCPMGTWDIWPHHSPVRLSSKQLPIGRRNTYTCTQTPANASKHMFKENTNADIIWTNQKKIHVWHCLEGWTKLL